MSAPTLGQVEGNTLLVAGGIALIVVLYVLKQAPAAVAGAVTGKNALTENATNADGTPQTAYYGAGPLGTLGAATNAVSGGWLSTWGDDFGSWFYGATHSDPLAPAPAPAPQPTYVDPTDALNYPGAMG